MNRDKLIRELRGYAKSNGLYFDIDKRGGKGSHYIVTVGEKVTIVQSDIVVQSDINEQRANRVKKQLGVS